MYNCYAFGTILRSIKLSKKMIPSQDIIRIFDHYDRFMGQFGDAGGHPITPEQTTTLIKVTKKLEKKFPVALIFHIYSFCPSEFSSKIVLNPRSLSIRNLSAVIKWNEFKATAISRLGNAHIPRIRDALLMEPGYHFCNIKRILPAQQNQFHRLVLNVFYATMTESEIVEMANRINPTAMTPSFFEGLKITVIRCADAILTKYIGPLFFIVPFELSWVVFHAIICFTYIIPPLVDLLVGVGIQGLLPIFGVSAALLFAEIAKVDCYAFTLFKLLLSLIPTFAEWYFKVTNTLPGIMIERRLVPYISEQLETQIYLFESDRVNRAGTVLDQEFTRLANGE